MELQGACVLPMISFYQYIQKHPSSMHTSTTLYPCSFPEPYMKNEETGITQEQPMTNSSRLAEVYDLTASLLTTQLQEYSRQMMEIDLQLLQMKQIRGKMQKKTGEMMIGGAVWQKQPRGVRVFEPIIITPCTR